MSVAEILSARHLHPFDCVYCGHVDYSPITIQIGEVFLCWSCLCDMTAVAVRSADDCACNNEEVAV